MCLADAPVALLTLLTLLLRRLAAKTVFIGNLPWSVTEEDMLDLFGEVGEVVSVRIAEDQRTGKRKGFAHIEYATHEAAVKAVEFDGEELEGRAVRVDLSAPRARAHRPASLSLAVYLGLQNMSLIVHMLYTYTCY